VSLSYASAEEYIGPVCTSFKYLIMGMLDHVFSCSTLVPQSSLRITVKFVDYQWKFRRRTTKPLIFKSQRPAASRPSTPRPRMSSVVIWWYSVCRFEWL